MTRPLRMFLSGGGRGWLRRFIWLFQKPDISSHFQTRDQIRIAGFAAHGRFRDAVRPFRLQKSRPLFDHRFSIFLLSLYTFVKRHVSEALLQVRLLCNSVAQRRDVESGVLIGSYRRNRYRQRRRGKERD